MNKRPIYIVVACLSLFCVASIISAAGLTNPLDPIDSIPKLLEKIADGIGTLIAAAGTVMIIVAGIFYLTSAGSQERMTKAKTALLFALAGIAIGLAAKAIVSVIENIIGAK